MSAIQDGGLPALLSEKIRAALATDIASGRYEALTPLDEQQIADRFGASRTPVREAFRMLAADGLIDFRPRRGVVVAALTPERISEMFEVMAEIEAICARLAAARMTPFERCELKRAHDESAPCVGRGAGDYADFNLEFHCLIYSGTHNEFLKEHALSLRARMAAFRQAQLHDVGRLDVSFNEHGQIVDAIVQGDSESAGKLMRAHLINASMSLERYARHREPSDRDDR